MSYGVGQKGFADLQAQYSGQQLEAAKAIKPTITTKTEKEMDAGDVLGQLAGIGLAAYGAYKGAQKPKSNKVDAPKESKTPGMGSDLGFYMGVDSDTLLGIAQSFF